MKEFERFLGKTCDGCRLCRYARDNPSTMFGRIMAWHGTWCPAWKAQQKLELERQEEARRKRNRRRKQNRK